jgi:hypothetical protein
VAVEAAGAYFGHLQAAERSELTIRSYGLDLLRWFRFLWAAGVRWDWASRAEARDFCRWLMVAGKTVRPHWRERRLGPDVPGLASGRAYAPSVRAHCAGCHARVRHQVDLAVHTSAANPDFVPEGNRRARPPGGRPGAWSGRRR